MEGINGSFKLVKTFLLAVEAGLSNHDAFEIVQKLGYKPGTKCKLSAEQLDDLDDLYDWANTLFPRNRMLLLLWVLAGLSATASSKTFNFLSVGDWGDKEFLQLVAENFDKQGKDAAVALLLGDNFYEAGVKSTTDQQWETKYQQFFTGPNMRKAKFMVASGNHDYYGNVSAQVAYKDPTNRWLFPALYHARRFTQHGIKVMFVMVDTWRLNGGDTVWGHNPATGRTWLRSEAALWKQVAEGDISPQLALELLAKHPKRLSEQEEEEEAGKGDPQQLEWIRQVLTSPAGKEADWRFVCGHFPIRSATLQEHGDTKNLVRVLEPLLEELEVDAYFSGHDHVLQVIKRKGEHTLHYYGPGAGARKHPIVNAQYEGLQGHSEGKLGFMRHRLTKTEMTTALIDEFEHEVFSLTQEKNPSTAEGNPGQILEEF
ncbi:hypothetical protein BASA81_006920 [Batrachochytrium salamandrivorans]|nr:hypothetical protein BASA81_006920 [Batrachochytrium salamandrivorans]